MTKRVTLPSKRSATELLTHSKHVSYEIEMFVQYTELLVDPLANKQQRIIAIEGQMLHARQLLGFFFPGKNKRRPQPNACEASQWAPGWDSNSCPTLLESAYDEANNRLAHITWDRKDVLEWRSLHVSKLLAEVILKFLSSFTTQTILAPSGETETVWLAHVTRRLGLMLKNPGALATMTTLSDCDTWDMRGFHGQ